MNPADIWKTTGGGVIPNLGRVLMTAGRPVSAKAIDRLFGTLHEDLYGGSSRVWPIAGDERPGFGCDQMMVDGSFSTGENSSQPELAAQMARQMLRKH